MNARTVAPTVILVLLAVFTTAFAFMNYGNPVKVWPLMSTHPLTVVIAVTFLLGACTGGLLVHILHQRRIPSSAPLRASTSDQKNQ
jgi:hypothetical protein